MTERRHVELGSEIRSLLRIAAPLMLAQGGLTLMGLVDTWFVGRVSTDAMAGVALGNAIATVFVVVGLGIAMGLEPLAAQAFGAGDETRASWWRQQGLYATGAVSAAMVGLHLLLALGILMFESSSFADATRDYMLGRTPGVFFAALYGAERGFLTSIGRSRPALYAVLAANLVNLLADALFVWGLGWGAGGVGVATTLSSAAMWWVARRYSLRKSAPSAAVDRDGVRRVIQLGWPIAAQLAAEVGIFSGVSALIAFEGPAPLAAHQIALGLASVTFMASVGIGVAATARVGHRLGAGEPKLARQVGFLALGLGGSFMAVGGLVYFVFAEPIAREFAPDSPEVVRSAAVFLRIAAIFAVSDGLQAVGAGALRGAGDTRWTFVLNLLGHGLVGAPVGLGLALGADWGAVGYWWGLTAGLSATALGLILRFAWLTARPLAPLAPLATSLSVPTETYPYYAEDDGRGGPNAAGGGRTRLRRGTPSASAREQHPPRASGS